MSSTFHLSLSDFSLPSTNSTHSQLFSAVSRTLPPCPPLLSSAMASAAATAAAYASADEATSPLASAAVASVGAGVHPALPLNSTQSVVHSGFSISAPSPPQECSLFSDDTNRLIRLTQSVGSENISADLLEETRKFRDELSTRSAADRAIEQFVNRTRGWIAYVAGAAVAKAVQSNPQQHTPLFNIGMMKEEEITSNAASLLQGHGQTQQQLLQEEPTPILPNRAMLSASNLSLLRNLPLLESISSHSTPGPLSGLTTPSLYQTPSSSPAATPAISPRNLSSAQATMSGWNHASSSLSSTAASGESSFTPSRPLSSLASATLSSNHASPSPSPTPTSLASSISTSSTQASPALTPAPAGNRPQKAVFPASSSSRSSSCHRCQTRPKDGVELFRCLNVIPRRRGASTSSSAANESVCGRLYCSGRCMQPLGFQSREEMSEYFKAGQPCPHCKDPFSCMNSNCVALKRRRFEAQGEQAEAATEQKEAEKKRRKRRKSTKDSAEDCEKKSKKAKKRAIRKDEKLKEDSCAQQIQTDIPIVLNLPSFPLPSLPYSAAHPLAQNNQPMLSPSVALSSQHTPSHSRSHSLQMNISAAANEASGERELDSTVMHMKVSLNGDDEFVPGKCRRVEQNNVLPFVRVTQAYGSQMDYHSALHTQWTSNEALSIRHHQGNSLAVNTAAVCPSYPLFKVSPIPFNESSSSLDGCLASSPSDCESDGISVHDELVDELENQSAVGYLNERMHAHSRSHSPMPQSSDDHDHAEGDACFSDDSSASPMSSYELLLHSDDKDELNA